MPFTRAYNAAWRPEHPARLLTIVGPTAVGKSALAVEVCEALGNKWSAPNSRQVYRLMDIGTDKPGHADRARVAHHAIDLVDPDEPFTLAMYQDMATAAVIHEVQERRRRCPCWPGARRCMSTRSWRAGRFREWSRMPELRGHLEEAAGKFGTRKLCTDAYTSATRWLPSAYCLLITQDNPGSGGNRGDRPPHLAAGPERPEYDILTIALECERKELYDRIDRRVDSQIERGLWTRCGAREGYAGPAVDERAWLPADRRLLARPCDAP